MKSTVNHDTQAYKTPKNAKMMRKFDFYDVFRCVIK